MTQEKATTAGLLLVVAGVSPSNKQIGDVSPLIRLHTVGV